VILQLNSQIDFPAGKPRLSPPQHRTGWSGLAVHERVALFYFCLLAAWGFIRPFAASRRALLVAVPIGLYLLCVWESRVSRAWSRVAREWSSLGVILVAYLSLQLFADARLSSWEHVWVGWDRRLLDAIGFRAAVEAFGRLIPDALESAYLMLYVLPHLSLAAVYFIGERFLARKFLLVLFLGTFTAYILIPCFPVASPRMAFPNLDLPSFQSLPRTINEWLLDHMDISTGVFPSGHVAVAFSCAFGLLSAMPRRRKVWMTAFIIASMVYLATIYGRYHYAVDGLASILIAALAWRITEHLHPHEA